MSILSLSTTAPGASADYINYLYAQPVMIDRLGDPTFMDLKLVPADSAFVKLRRGNYVTFSTVTKGIWYTGYVQNDPELERLGTHLVAGVPTEVFGYIYELSSDEYLLNLKPIGLMPPFFNKTQGYILKTLATRLSPTLPFTTTAVADGLTVARYIPDQTARFSDIVKSFCDSGNFRFQAKNHALIFEQQDTTPAPIVIDGNDVNFTAADLTLKRTNESIVNDAIVLGDVEPSNYMTEIFVGDGITARFPLISSVFGVDSTLLLDDDFSSTTFDTSKWVEFDPVTNYIQLFNGYVNVLGGSNNGSYDVHLDGLNQIPLEGMLRITHGEYDFVSASDGVICGLWTDTVGATFANCFYGIRVTKSGLNTVIQPMINGTVDATQTLTVDYTNRYVIRTVYSMQSQNRFGQAYSYTDAAGVVHQVSLPNLSDVADVQTFISEIDATTGNLVSTRQWSNTAVALTNAQCYGTYVPVLSNDLNLTFTGVTVSTPMQATLGILQKFRLGYAYPQIGTYVRPSAPNGHFYQVIATGTSQIEPVWPTTSGATVVSGGVTFKEVGTQPLYNPQIIGPNEIDSFDGLKPLATITDANQGATTRSSKLGTGQYNFGNPALVFFTDTVNLNSGIPWAGDLIKVTYRRAAVAMARAQDATSIATEATAWSDDGLRSVVRGLNGDISPSPRNSSECLIAAQAIVGDLGRQRWDGTYKGTNLYSFTGQPLSGTTLTFQNLSASFPTLQAEVLQEVRTTMVASIPREIFTYEITFGSKDTLKKAVDKFIKKTDLFQQDTTELPPAIDITAIATAFAPDVLAPSLVSWDTANFNLSTNQGPPVSGGFEVRYTDESWGQTPGKNLIYKGTSQTFSVPRNYRGKVVFVKAYTSTGELSQYASGIHIALPLIPSPPTGQVTYAIPTAPIVTFQMPINQEDIWGVEVRTSTANPNGLVLTPTVLYHVDLVDPNYTDSFTDVNNLSLVLCYDLFSYNLLGEYSVADNLLVTNPYVQTNSVTGQNLLSNAGFEKNLLGLTLNTERFPTQVLIDDWFVK